MRYLIIGGTGSLGEAFIDCVWKREHDLDVTSLSREELKQINLRKKFPFVKTVIGDVKDEYSLEKHIKNADAVFNFAALKHVDICEDNQAESFKNNLLGAMNVADLCERYDIAYSVFSSTDKAVLPINVYGFHKGAAERYYMEKNAARSTTCYSVFRWGNVCGSRGSVVHKFKDTLTREKAVYITHEEMTRFWIDIKEVAVFMYDNFKLPTNDVAHIPAMKSSSVIDLASAVAKVLNISDYKTFISGIRRGEKIHEVLQSEHERFGGCIRSDTAPKFTFPELCDLVERTLSV